MEYYECPACKTANEDYIKYCKKCGVWLLSETFPAKKIVKQSAGKKILKIIGGMVLAFVGVIGLLVYLGKGSAGMVTFDDMSLGDNYTISQFIVSKSMNQLTATADVTVLKDMEHPLNIVAVFYDSDDKRLIKATSNIAHRMLSNQTTTIDFAFDQYVDIRQIASVRVEVIPISPMETIDKFIEQIM